MLKALLLEERDKPLSDAGEMLQAAGYELISSVPIDGKLPARVARLTPDLILIQTTSPSRMLLDGLREVQESSPCPVVLFTGDDDTTVIQRAIGAGVSAYVVDEIHAERLRPIVEAARARFQRYRQLESELDRTRTQLEDRKRIERAKGIVMQQKGISEEDAYHLLRKAAMERNKRLSEIAEGIIATHDLLGEPV